MNVEALIKWCLEGEKQFTKRGDEWQSENLSKYNPDSIPQGKGRGHGGDREEDKCRKAFVFSLGHKEK